MYSPWHDWDSTLVTNRVMDSGIHRISLIYTVPTKETISTMMGFEVEQLGTNFLPKPPPNFVSAAAASKLVVDLPLRPPHPPYNRGNGRSQEMGVTAV